MGSKSKVVSYANQAVSARAIEDKINALARAIAELADFVDDLENQLRRIENNQR